MTRHSAIATVFLAAFATSGVACAHVPKGAEVEPAPITETAAGRNEVRLKMAEALIDKGETTEARQVLETAASEGAPKAEIELLQGRALAHEGLSGAALEKLEAARKAMPRDPRPYRAIGLVHADLHEIDQALAAFQRATELDENDAATWNNYGFLLLSAKSYDDARAALERAVTLDGSVPRYRRNLGYALAALGREREALAAFRGAGTEAEAQTDLGLAYELAGDATQAEEHYRLALAADDSQAEALKGLARISHPAEEAP